MTDRATSKDSIHAGGGHRKGEPEIVVEDGGLKNQLQKYVLSLPVVLVPLYFSQY